MKIVLLGAYSVGKTTVTRELQAKYNLKGLPDVARIYAERNNIRFDEVKNPYDILRNQVGIAKLYKEIKEEYTNNYVEDGSGILGIVYTKLFCSSIKHTSEYEEGLQLIKDLNILPLDEIKILLPISFPIRKDGLRHSDSNLQKKVENELLAHLNHNNIPFYFVNEPNKQNRIDVIKNYIDSLYKITE